MVNIMMTATVTSNHTINVSDFKVGEKLIIMRDSDYQREIERSRHNAAYFEKLDKGYGSARKGKTPAEYKALVESLIGSANFPPEYDDPNYDPEYELAREAAYRAKGLIE